MTFGHEFAGSHRPAVGDAVELIDVTGDWGPGTPCTVLRPLSTHVLVTVVDEDGRHVETMPVGYESIRPSGTDRPVTAPRRRPLVA